MKTYRVWKVYLTVDCMGKTYKKTEQIYTTATKKEAKARFTKNTGLKNPRCEEVEA